VPWLEVVHRRQSLPFADQLAPLKAEIEKAIPDVEVEWVRD
jgi:hypothetical protein